MMTPDQKKIANRKGENGKLRIIIKSFSLGQKKWNQQQCSYPDGHLCVLALKIPPGSLVETGGFSVHFLIISKYPTPHYYVHFPYGMSFAFLL